MAIWGSPAHCCQPAVVGGVIYADLRSELNTHLAQQALFTQSSPVHEPLLQAFPFPSILGEVTLYPLCQACVFYLQLTWEVGLPPLQCSFPPTAAFTSFPASACWAALHLLPSAAGLWGISPPQLLSTQGAPSSLLRVFFFVIACHSISFFSLGGGRSVRGTMLIRSRVVCERTMCRLAHLVVHIFPSHLGSGVWRRCWIPPGFSVQREVEMLCSGWRTIS
jgi:hypothetical protein